MFKRMNLQLFAGENQEMPVRQYQKEFKELLQAVFEKQAYFADFFGGKIEAMDGVQENENAFYVKTTDIPVAVGTYSKESAVAFGVGTGKTSRFGNRTEIIYKDTPVPYTWGWAFHEGLDRHTVNNDLEAALADRLELQARVKVGLFNTNHGKFISQSAGKNIADEATITKDNVAGIFNKLSKHFVDVGAIGTKVAKVIPDVYNAIVDCGLAVSSKGSTVNMDEGSVLRFKGFIIEEVPTALFQSTEAIYAYITGVGKAFTGIETSRTIESEDFDGVALQGTGRAGEFILNDNKQAVVKVTASGM